MPATGDWDLDGSQKAALPDFVRSGGGLVVMHGGLDANHAWQDYIDMVGGEFVKQDELYVIRNFSRGDIEVLVSVDKELLDMSHVAWQLPPDRGIPVAWRKRYGKGGVFASTIGHTSESFYEPEVARMYTESIKWTLQLTGAGEAP